MPSPGLLQLAAPRLEDRVPLDLHSFLVLILPVLACHQAMAVLVLLPSTRAFRLALLPLGISLAWRAGTRIDVSSGIPKYNHNNYAYCIMQLTMSLQMLEWGIRRQPLERPQRDTPRSVYADAVALCCTMRGIGWPWSRGLYIPPETRPTHSNAAFLRSTALRALRDMAICDACQTAIRLLGPGTFGSLRGGTIFDARLAPPPRYALASLVAALTATGIYFSLTMLYHGATLLGFALAPHPRAWPPLAHAPWAAPSLRAFWGARWHQLFRGLFVALGARPGAAVGGRAGGVLGAFALSAVLHDVGIWGMGRGTAFPQIGGFFLLNGVGVVVEEAFERATGRKVRGYAGWAWTMLFVLATGNLLVDAWLTRGLAGACAIPDFIRPTWLLAQVWPALRTALL